MQAPAADPSALASKARMAPAQNDDVFHLQRFLEAQRSTFDTARAELAAGQKRSHWMWFIFPQIQGLGSSPMAQRYALSGLREATAYLRHPVLGARLRECTALVNGIEGRSVEQIFGYPDDLKFHSSMTLFAQAVSAGLQPSSPEDNVFSQALERFFGGTEDQGTLSRLNL